MAENLDQMTGAERAAVFLLSLGEEAAASVLRQLNPMEVQNVGEAMTNLNTVSPEKIANVVGDFTETVRSGATNLVGSDDYIKRVLHEALGEDKAKSMLSRILQAQNPQGLEALKWMEPGAVSALIKDEHPQICAIVLLSLEGEHAAQVLKQLPEDKRPEIMLRVANLNSINPGALDELNEMMQKQLADSTFTSNSEVDGIRTAANILNFLGSDMEASILDAIQENDEEMSDFIREKMFIFENLMVLSDRELQRMLREVDTENLVLALKGSEEAIRNKFYNNMSRRASEMLREDIDMRGPVKLSEVEGAQKEILNTAARLADEGEISFGDKGDEEYV